MLMPGINVVSFYSAGFLYQSPAGVPLRATRWHSRRDYYHSQTTFPI